MESTQAQAELLEQILLHSQDCIVLLDGAFNFIKVSESYAAACGRKAEDFPGRNHFELYPSDFIEDWRQVVATGQPFRAEARPFVFPDHPEWGETFWDLALVPLFDRQGKVDGLIFTLKDVTRHERMLRELQRTNRALLAISACNALLARATDEAELLEGMCRIVVDSGGYLDAWIGLSETGPEDRPRVDREAGRSLVVLPLKVGGVLCIHSAEPGAFGDGEIALLEQLAEDFAYGLANLREKSARKATEEKLRQSEARYHQLFENGTDAIALADAETGEILDINRAMENLVG